jgi:hypothetical protein
MDEIFTYSSKSMHSHPKRAMQSLDFVAIQHFYPHKEDKFIAKYSLKIFLYLFE